MTAYPDALHIEERVEQRIDELCALGQEAGKFLLQSCVHVVILVRCNFKILLKLIAAQETQGDENSVQLKGE